jgi:hypothetical protein
VDSSVATCHEILWCFRWFFPCQLARSVATGAKKPWIKSTVSKTVANLPTWTTLALSAVTSVAAGNRRHSITWVASSPYSRYNLVVTVSRSWRAHRHRIFGLVSSFDRCPMKTTAWRYLICDAFENIQPGKAMIFLGIVERALLGWIDVVAPAETMYHAVCFLPALQRRRRHGLSIPFRLAGLAAAVCRHFSRSSP